MLAYSFVAVLMVASLASSKPKSPYQTLYVFGDSYSDIGEGYLDGNGPTAVAFLGSRMGLTLLPANDPDMRPDSSLDLAISGAQTGYGDGRKVGEARLGYGMKNQVDDFAKLVTSGQIRFRPEAALFFIAGGLNDRKLPTETTVANLESEITSLYHAGARHFALALMPTAIPSFSEVGKRLNPAIQSIPAAMTAQLPGVEINLSHWGLFFNEVMEKPLAYGIKNTTDACAGRSIFNEDSKPCNLPATYFYYHAGHPSMAVHKVVGDKLYLELLAIRPEVRQRRQSSNQAR